MKIPLLMLHIGIRYLKYQEDRAIFGFSKEERKVFEDFVLKPRENIEGKQSSSKKI
jgi:hypothetical protein